MTDDNEDALIIVGTALLALAAAICWCLLR
jgi:hypothetical protein